jgi:hypothetical protein
MTFSDDWQVVISPNGNGSSVAGGSPGARLNPHIDWQVETASIAMGCERGGRASASIVSILGYSQSGYTAPLGGYRGVESEKSFL